MKKWTPALYHADCLDVLPGLEADSIDTCITDPPYGLSAGPAGYIGEKMGGGFMGKKWDHGVPGVPFWKAVLRVLKPGAFLLAFGGDRTHHRLMVAIEDAGFEIRTCIYWIFGSGFPKSHSISKQIDRAAGAEREVIGPGRWHSEGRKEAWGNGDKFGKCETGEGDGKYETAPATPEARTWDGYGTALKPAVEIIIMAMKPLDGNFAQNALTHGVAGLNIDGARIGTTVETWPKSRSYAPGQMQPGGKGQTIETGPIPSGRWPANLVTDGSPEVLQGFPETTSGAMKRTVGAYPGDNVTGFLRGNSGPENQHGDTGSASRYFYTAKADGSERNHGVEDFFWKREDGDFKRCDYAHWKALPEDQRARGNVHPTVKPVSLLTWLAELTKTPTGGIVLDPFMGSGTTGIACYKTGRDFIGIDSWAVAYQIAEGRLKAQTEGKLF